MDMDMGYGRDVVEGGMEEGLGWTAAFVGGLSRSTVIMSVVKIPSRSSCITCSMHIGAGVVEKPRWWGQVSKT
jgi:hypothetical protein